jgi:NADPH:quinone reductase
VDVILEMTGGAIFEQSFACLAPVGRMVAYGNASGQRMTVEVPNLMPQNQTITGFFLSGLLAAMTDESRSLIVELLAELGRYVAVGRLRLHLGGRFKFARACDAHRAIEGRDTMGKIVLVP